MLPARHLLLSLPLADERGLRAVEVEEHQLAPVDEQLLRGPADELQLQLGWEVEQPRHLALAAAQRRQVEVEQEHRRREAELAHLVDVSARRQAVA